jgi:hypothetical protein
MGGTVRKSDIDMLRFLSVAITACITSIAMAQSDPEPDGFVLDEIIVTARRTDFAVRCQR